MKNAIAALPPAGSLIRFAGAALILFGLCLSAQAQYAWIDENGRKQYSDMPPPASVPENRIFKQPGMRSTRELEQPARAATTPEKAATTANLADREADFRKRRTEKAEKEKQAAEQARIATENKERCERLADYRRALEAGERIARRGPGGERELMDEQAMARELADTKRKMESCI